MKTNRLCLPLLSASIGLLLPATSLAQHVIADTGFANPLTHFQVGREFPASQPGSLPNDSLVQTFTANVAGGGWTLGELTVWGYQVSGPTPVDLHVDIFDFSAGLGSYRGGVDAAVGTFSGTPSLVTIDLSPAAISLVSGQQYAIVFSTAANGVVDNMNGDYSFRSNSANGGDNYAGGTSYRFINYNPFTQTPVSSMSGDFGSDMAFKLTATAAAIPEPSTYAAIAGAGALGLAAWRRRRVGFSPTR